MGGGRPIAECRCVPAPFFAGQPDTLMQGFLSKQTKNRNWRHRFAILTPRLFCIFPAPTPRAVQRKISCIAFLGGGWGYLSVCVRSGALYFYTGRTGDHTKGVVPLSSQTDIFDMAKGPGLMPGHFFSVEFATALRHAHTQGNGEKVDVTYAWSLFWGKKTGDTAQRSRRRTSCCGCTTGASTTCGATRRRRSSAG